MKLRGCIANSSRYGRTNRRRRACAGAVSRDPAMAHQHVESEYVVVETLGRCDVMGIYIGDDASTLHCRLQPCLYARPPTLAELLGLLRCEVTVFPAPLRAPRTDLRAALRFGFSSATLSSSDTWLVLVIF